jgi:hypothetical protein
VFGTLSPAQERVYNAVLKLEPRPMSGPREPDTVVAPFGAADLADVLEKDKGKEELHPSFVDETLSLLEAMGVVVRAHITTTPGGSAVPYYRLATSWDEPATPAAAAEP